jgi:hypothetical protein
MSSISIFIALLVTVVNLLDAIGADSSISPSLKAKADQMRELAIQMTVEAVNSQDQSEGIGAPSEKMTLATPSCVPDLKLSGKRQTESTVLFHATYSTGCILDQRTAYSWSVANASSTILEEHRGTFAQAKYPDDSLWKFEYSQTYRTSPVIVTFTAGPLTRSISIQ